ncbi:hypothetical protein [Streptomyces sp. MUM 16J]|uniref:hypothetical protein n=1 Tax=Streptomyces sp. MUM 16J TaxID=2791988 RepID=UPI001F04DE25|nr:hypothetical protein [Streptomyces sp. MUM 16J]MCH0557222.1 hypothetical protein [Streptomyces sp. MUM 16J]
MSAPDARGAAGLPVPDGSAVAVAVAVADAEAVRDADAWGRVVTDAPDWGASGSRSRDST